MISAIVRRVAILIVAWLPLFAFWVLSAMFISGDGFSEVIVSCLISMGTGGLLAIGVWHLCQRWPWPARLNAGFYALQVVFAVAYALVWTAIVFVLESLRLGMAAPGFWSWQGLGRDCCMGIWLYGLFAGISFAVQTRDRLHEKEGLAARAQALATSARLDALRARLNPHFLFNALHTLDALVKFRPALAEGAIERLGDMLRYALKEDGRELVEFSEEYEFTRQYLAFEQLRYEDRLKIDLKIERGCFDFEIPPFSIQTLAENAVRHAISVRPEGGSIWITCEEREGRMVVSVRDDGPGESADTAASHQLGLRSLRERLTAAYGPGVDLNTSRRPEGFEARFSIPISSEKPVV